MAPVSMLKGLVLALALAYTAQTQAQELDWPQLPYRYMAQGENLRDVLIHFGANYDSSVIASDQVND